MNNTAQTVQDVIYARRSIRDFVADKPVEEEKLTLLLQAAMAAPSACNLQPWEFIVVSEPETLSRLKDATPTGKYNAPLAIVVCGNTSCIPWQDDGWMIDCSAAVTNMMLLATALDLGSVWIGSFEEDKLRALLDIPEGIQIMNMVYFGYPAQPRAPKTRYTPDAVFHEKYDPARKRELRTMDMLYDSSTLE